MGTIYDGRPKVKHEIINGIESKKCTKCNMWKPLNEFNKKKDMSDGLRNACRNCQKLDTKKYRKENLDKEKKRAKVNRKKFKEYYKKYHKKWEIENREKRYTYTERRRARKNHLPDTLTEEQWEWIKKQFNYSCAYCGKSNCKLEYEHFTPLTKDKHWGTSKENIIPVCSFCNRSKKNYIFEDWYPKQDFFSKERSDFIIKHISKMRNQETHYIYNNEMQLRLF